MSPKETAYIVERLAVRFMAMVADYERKLVEHRDSFGARTSADAKIIEGLRRELFMLTGLNDKLIVDREEAWKERDVLLTQVQNMRAEIKQRAKEQDQDHKTIVSRLPVRIVHPDDFFADLTQLHAKGKEAWSDVPNATQWVEEMRGNSEATHDTEAGKAAAESAAHSAEIDIGTRSRKVTT